MPLSRYIIIAMFLAAAQLPAQWPDNLKSLRSSLCLVEYFQPQSENRDIKDEARIKLKITGILVSSSGLVITSDLIYPVNLDIVAGNSSFTNLQEPPEDITVAFNRDKKIKAHFVGKDEELRLAFIQIEEPAADLPPPVSFDAEAQYRPGDPVFFIQHLDGRYDNEIFLSAGFINAVLDRSPQKLLSDPGSPPLSPGGLVVNKKGRAVGIVCRNSFVSFSRDIERDMLPAEKEFTEILPARYFIPLIKNPPQLINQKTGGGKSWLGIQMQVLRQDMAAYWNLAGIKGLIVTSIIPLSPAEKAGLHLGDLITAIGNFKINSADEKTIEIFRNYVRSLPEGPVILQVIRDRLPLSLTVPLESAPKSQYLAEEFYDEILGLSVKELTQDLFLNHDLDFDTEGVWVARVEEAGAASLAGLEVDDLILNIDDTRIKNLAGFREIIQKLEQGRPEYIQVFIRRDQSTQYVFIKTGLSGK